MAGAGIRFYGEFDQAGEFAPLSGEQAATFRALPGVRMNTANDYDGPRKVRGVGGHNVGGYMGNTGFLHPMGVADTPIANAPGYFGDAPADIQPGIGRPSPWLDPTGASGGA